MDAAGADDDEEAAGGVAALDDGDGFVAAGYDGAFGGVCLGDFELEEVGGGEGVEAFDTVIFEGGGVAAGGVVDEEGHDEWWMLCKEESWREYVLYIVC